MSYIKKLVGKLSVYKLGISGFFAVLVANLFLPATYADTGPGGNLQQAPSVSITSVGGIICYIVYAFRLLFWLLMALATVMVIVGAYNYLTSQGDSEKVSKGTKTLMWAAIAVAVALIAYNVPSIVGSFFNVSTVQQGLSCP